MLARNRFILLLVVGVVLAVLSYSVQYLQLVPVSPVESSRSGVGKSRKRVNPVLQTPPATPDPLAGAYRYCNTPNRTQQTWEGHSPADYQLLSVQVMIRHGDRYPLYSIPRTKKPPIDCTLSPNKAPSHPLLSSFISDMAKDGQTDNWDASLTSLARLPNHRSCEMGELTQTGVVQHLRNGQVLRGAYLRGVPLLPASLGSSQVLLETTGKSRTLQSGLALVYGLLPGFSRPALKVRQHWNALFCGRACDCPARQRHLEAEQRRQYRLRVADTRLDRAYVDMAAALGVAPRVLRAANPVDALLCHLCHGLPFPCRVADGSANTSSSPASSCLTPAHLAEIRRQQEEDERERQVAGLYHRYAVLAAQPYLERTAARMERVARGNPAPPPSEPLVTVASAHDITMAPLLSALGLEGVAGFPSFAARLVMELWRRPNAGGARDRARVAEEKGKEWGRELRAKRSQDDLFVRVLYNGEDLTFHTTFCRTHPRHTHTPLCPLGKFLRFVRGDIFSPLNATSYQQACHATGP
ncbi:2-phosphoxylose phosphatase 1 isoform X1 [Alosa sapidissima]|uniref:2-phosphoxylose phosphatase 1 isoform X1 n=1 Tax=Alosa sapidissima TaxID=34773 RepID=UPI001C0A53D8|nr:2-phosphoxylose phosphatase 1 isoform X1 [Alosa sapidissima]